MGWFTRLWPGAETRSAPAADPAWAMLRTGAIPYGSEAGVPVSPYLAENLSAVCACVQAIAETVAMLPASVYRRLPNGAREEAPQHPIALLLGCGADPNDWQTAPEFIEMMTGHCLLRGNAYAQIVWDGRGAPSQLIPIHPDWVQVIRIAGVTPNRYAFDVTIPWEGRTRRLLPEEMLHLKDRSDDGVVGKSRLHRAREAFGSAIATERFANHTFKNSASLSGVLSYPGQLPTDAARRLRREFEEIYKGTENSGRVGILEEGMRWQSISVSPDDAQMLESRKFSVEALARIFRVPAPIIGAADNMNYSAISEIGRWFYSMTIQPWLERWERVLERSLLSTAGRAQYEVEFDADLIMRTDMLTRYQAYRIAREIGLASANELRKWENLNPRTDPGGDEFLTPANMNTEQTGRPVADRGAEPVIA